VGVLGNSFQIWPGTGSSGTDTTARARLQRWGNLGKWLLRNKGFGGISGDSRNFGVRLEVPLKISCFSPYSFRRET